MQNRREVITVAQQNQSSNTSKSRSAYNAGRKFGGQNHKPNARRRQYNPRERQFIPAAAVRPCVSKKVQYLDRSSAEKALARIAIQREQDLIATGTTTWNQNRAYRCQHCGVLHLTSTEEMWFATEVTEADWQKATEYVAQQRLQANAATDFADVTFERESSATPQSRDDWDVAA